MLQLGVEAVDVQVDDITMDTVDEDLPYIRHMGGHLCHMVNFFLPYVVIW